jgi:hypothetical protein
MQMLSAVLCPESDCHLHLPCHMACLCSLLAAAGACVTVEDVMQAAAADCAAALAAFNAEAAGINRQQLQDQVGGILLYAWPHCCSRCLRISCTDNPVCWGQVIGVLAACSTL